MLDLFAGVGKTLPELYVSLFGPSKSAKAFRAVMKDPPGYNGPADQTTVPLLPLAAIAIADLAGSQEFKTLWDNKYWKWRNVRDPAGFAKDNGWMLKDLKQWLDAMTGVQPTRLSKVTNDFLKQWVNTDGKRMPTPGQDIVTELWNFRPETTRIYYRGVRFHDIGEMVKFHQHFATGKAFPFKSERYTSWSTSQVVAEKFGRYNSASSQNDAMMGWLSRAKANKDYDGKGGYLIGARVQPSQCLVDLTNHELPFGGGIHGGEGEVIVLPDTALVCKVYGVYGNPEADVEQFLQDKYQRNSPSDPYFFQYPLSKNMFKVQGDSEEGDVTFDMETVTTALKHEYQSKYKNDPLARLTQDFNRQLYEVAWHGDTAHYTRMTLPKRVASRWQPQPG